MGVDGSIVHKHRGVSDNSVDCKAGHYRMEAAAYDGDQAVCLFFLSVACLFPPEMAGEHALINSIGWLNFLFLFVSP